MLHIKPTKSYYLIRHNEKTIRKINRNDFIRGFRQYMQGVLNKRDVLMSVSKDKVILLQNSVNRNKIVFSSRFLKSFNDIEEWFLYDTVEKPECEGISKNAKV